MYICCFFLKSELDHSKRCNRSSFRDQTSREIIYNLVIKMETTARWIVGRKQNSYDDFFEMKVYAHRINFGPFFLCCKIPGALIFSGRSQ